MQKVTSIYEMLLPTPGDDIRLYIKLIYSKGEQWINMDIHLSTLEQTLCDNTMALGLWAGYSINMRQ